MPGFSSANRLAERQRARVPAGRLEQRRPFDIDLSNRMPSGERVIEQRGRLFEAVEASCEPRTDMERGRGVG